MDNLTSNFISKDKNIAFLTKENFENNNFKFIDKKKIIVYVECKSLESCIYILSDKDSVISSDLIQIIPNKTNKSIPGNYAEVLCSTENNVDWHIDDITYCNKAFLLTPFEWALSTIKNSKLSSKLIKTHQIELAHSIIFWNTHAYITDKKLIRINKFNKLIMYKHNDLMLVRSQNNIGQQLIDPIFKHYVYWAKENPNTYESNMIMFWKNKYKYKGEKNE